MGYSDISGRTLNRLCEGGPQVHPEQFKATSGGTIADCQLDCVQFGVLLLVLSAIYELLDNLSLN